MRTKDIQPGKTYYAKLSEQDSLKYRGCFADVRVIRSGFHYEVEESHGSMIRGAPMVHRHESEYPQGVEVEWDEQEVWSNRRDRGGRGKERLYPGRAIINSRSVRFEIKEKA